VAQGFKYSKLHTGLHDPRLDMATGQTHELGKIHLISVPSQLVWQI
jgi:hypothetical protein